MRECNRSGKGRIEFTGFDMQTPTVAMDIVRTFVTAQDGSYYTTKGFPEGLADNDIDRLVRVTA
jgi:hypothetical protein